MSNSNNNHGGYRPGLGRKSGLLLLSPKLKVSPVFKAWILSNGHTLSKGLQKVLITHPDYPVKGLNKTYTISIFKSPAVIINYSDRHSSIAEQFRAVRTNLYSLSPEETFKTILLTSAQPQEGKTTTSANLAFAMSESEGKKVILVDTVIIG